MKRIKLLVGSLLLLASVNDGYSQSLVCTTNPVITPAVPSSYDENAHSLVKDSGGNLIVVGEKNTSGNIDIVVSKITGCGVPAWTVSWGGAAHLGDRPWDVTTDGSGNIYITGMTQGSGYNSNILILKFNSSGTLQWFNTFATVNTDWGHSIAVYGSMVYVTGYTFNTPFSSQGITLAYDISTGANIWSHSYSTVGNARGYSVCADAAGVYVTGENKYGSGGAFSDIYTIKYNPTTGAVIWNNSTHLQQAANGGLNRPNRIRFDANGVVIGGTGYNNLTGADDFYILKYSFSGTLLWSTAYDRTGSNNVLRDVYVDLTNGKVFATGGVSISGMGANQSDVLTIGLNSSTGVLLWANQYDGVGKKWDYGMELDVDCMGQLFVGAKSQQVSNNNYEYLLLAHNPVTGAVAWTGSYNVGANYYDLNDIAVVSYGIFVSGTGGSPSKILVALWNGVTAPYNCFGARMSGDQGDDMGSSEFNLYPNPTTGVLNVSVQADGNISVINSQGQLVKEVVVIADENIAIDMTEFGNGIYYLILKDSKGSVSETKKFLINK